MREVRRQGERHGDVYRSDCQRGDEVAGYVAPFVLWDPLEEGEVIYDLAVRVEIPISKVIVDDACFGKAATLAKLTRVATAAFPSSGLSSL